VRGDFAVRVCVVGCSFCDGVWGGGLISFGALRLGLGGFEVQVPIWRRWRRRCLWWYGGG
jgi:hypothetical protein